MALQRTDAQPTDQPYQSANDEIDLTHYVAILFAWWREILIITIGIAVVAGAAGLLYNQSQTNQYQATATAVIARVFSDVTFDERFQTLSDSDASSADLTNTWRASLLGLTKSGSVAQAVIDDLGDLLGENEQNAAVLLESVDANLVSSSDGKTQSNLIRIAATADDPDKAAAIANMWVSHYIDEVNRVYGRVPDEVIAAVSTELESAGTVYQDAQLTLETFIAGNQMASLTRQIEEKQVLLDSLQDGKEAALNAVVSQDQTARLRVFQGLTDAQNNAAFAVLDEQVKQQLQSISQAYDARMQTLRLLDQARTVETQLQEGGNAASNELAIQLLKTEAFASMVSSQTEFTPLTVTGGEITGLGSPALPVLPGNLQFNIEAQPTVTTTEQLTDVQALIAALEKRIVSQDAQIEGISLALLNGEGINYLDQIDSENLTIASSDLTSVDQPFSEAIIRSYENLFGIGELVQRSQIQDEPADATNNLTAIITQLDSDIQALKSQLEAETGREMRLTQQRVSGMEHL